MGKQSKLKKLRTETRDQFHYGVVSLFREVASELLAKTFSKTRCLNATRIALNIFERFNMDAKAVATQAVAMNKAMWDRSQKGGHFPSTTEETDRWAQEDGSWAVGVVAGESFGHVICVTQGLLVDAAASQFARPEKKIFTPEILITSLPPGFLEGTPCVAGNHEGTVLTYHKTANRQFEGFPGFQNSPWNLAESEKIWNEMRNRFTKEK